MKLKELHDEFKDKLPAALGDPYIINTVNQPYIFAAFYEHKRHELIDGRILNGCEFRLWHTSKGFSPKPKVLAGIIGVSEDPPELVLCALTTEMTSSHDLAPYGDMIREVMGDILAGNIGAWH
jgi:hypothetical protein